VVGNRFETAEFAFEVVDMDRRRVDKLMVVRKPPGIGAV
jgi:CBS domain containing-hemolysin-like protein